MVQLERQQNLQSLGWHLAVMHTAVRFLWFWVQFTNRVSKLVSRLANSQTLSLDLFRDCSVHLVLRNQLATERPTLYWRLDSQVFNMVAPSAIGAPCPVLKIGKIRMQHVRTEHARTPDATRRVATIVSASNFRC